MLFIIDKRGSRPDLDQGPWFANPWTRAERGTLVETVFGKQTELSEISNDRAKGSLKSYPFKWIFILDSGDAVRNKANALMS